MKLTTNLTSTPVGQHSRKIVDYTPSFAESSDDNDADQLETQQTSNKCDNNVSENSQISLSQPHVQYKPSNLECNATVDDEQRH